MQLNQKPYSEEIEQSSLSRRQNFSSYLVEIPPHIQMPKKKVKKTYESEEDLKWKALTQKTLNSFKEWSKNAN